MLCGVAYFIISNEEFEMDKETNPIEESNHYFDFRPSSSGSSASESSTIQTEPSSSIDERTSDSLPTEGGEETLNKSFAFLDVNNKLFEAYYGEGTVEERNKQLRNILSEPLHSEYLVSDNSKALSEGVSEFHHRSFYNQEDSDRATVVNILELVSDGLDQQMLVTVELEFDHKWLISSLKFELIYG